MLAYRIDDMTCGHCVGTLTEAIRAVDGGATVDVDLGRHLLRVEPAKATAAQVRSAIEKAGYSPVALAAATPPDAAKAPGRGSCCGCCG